MTHLQKITPFLWFDHQAEAAAALYTAVFPNSRTGHVVRNGEAVMVVDFTLDGQSFSAMNGRPRFQFNPSISFYSVFETEAETDAAWLQLLEGGTVLMPLDRYDWSPKYGWVQDRFGVSWQIAQGKIAEVGQRITPLLMFCGAQQGKAEAALQLYTALFQPATLDGIARYEPGEPGLTGHVKHAQFRLGGQTFMVMDSGVEQTFSFTEAISLVIHCNNQEEVDRYWNRLTAEGGEESMCGWLKDKFGVSWQVIPEALPRLLGHTDPAVAQYAMSAMLNMRKIEVAKLVS